jgi:hypothetical protein
MLPGAIACEGFEPVAWRHGHVLQRTGPVELEEFSQGDAVNCRKTPVLFLVEKLLRIAVGEGLDHEGELPGSVRGFGRKSEGVRPMFVDFGLFWPFGKRCRAEFCYFYSCFVNQRVTGRIIQGGEIEINVEQGPAEVLAVKELYVVDLGHLGIGKPRVIREG